jgi:hypothetical protein
MTRCHDQADDEVYDANDGRKPGSSSVYHGSRSPPLRRTGPGQLICMLRLRLWPEDGNAARAEPPMLRGSPRPGKRGAPVHRSLPSSGERSWQVSSTSKSCSSTSRSIRCGPPRRHDGLSSGRHRNRRARNRHPL